MKKLVLGVFVLILLVTPVVANAQNDFASWEDLIPYIESLEKRIEELESINKSGESSKIQTLENIETAKPDNDIYATVEFKEQTITLNEYKIAGNSLILNYTIVNTGNKNISLSSLLSFTAKNNEGSKLELDWLSNGSSSLDGTIRPNDKLKGDIVFKIFGDSPYKIIYEPELWGSEYASWDVE